MSRNSTINTKLLEDSNISTKVAPVSPSAASNSSNENNFCWICFDSSSEEALISNICACKDRHVHKSCLKKWHAFAPKSQNQSGRVCPACKSSYSTTIDDNSSVHSQHVRIRIPRAHILPPSLTRRQLSLKWHFFLFFISGWFGYLFFQHGRNLVGEISIALGFNLTMGLLWCFASSKPLRFFNKVAYYMDVLLLGACYLMFLLGIAVGSIYDRRSARNRQKIYICGHAINLASFLVLATIRRCYVETE